MEEDIKVTGFRIKFYGERSAGIFDQVWLINGEHYFMDHDEMEEFKEKIRDAYEIVVGDRCEVKTFEELEQELDTEMRWV